MDTEALKEGSGSDIYGRRGIILRLNLFEWKPQYLYIQMYEYILCLPDAVVQGIALVVLEMGQ